MALPMLDRAPIAAAAALTAAVLSLACSGFRPPPAPQPPEPSEIVVTATAYNSVPEQGVGAGQHGAWGDRLRPGMKTIAVSRDLIALGLTRGAQVRIEGLDGVYTVLDRLPSRWNRRIDIYMGTDERAARAWGVREVRISWDQNAGAGSDETSHIAK
jgi:3D (Asp-Asp-Asp) domain-containing protein